MKTKSIFALLLIIVFASLTHAQHNSQKGFRVISRAALEDKIRGAWAGQMIGVSYGAPTEFKFLAKINDSDIKWSPEMVSNSIEQDDLYVEMTFTEVLDKIGLNATTKQFGEAFKNSKYSLWHANAGARRLLAMGIDAPLSGHPKYNIHANDIDFQIESDFIGIMTPGLPQEANKFADRVGHVMNYGDGVYGGMFIGGMYSAAFFETDMRKIVAAGLRSIPAKSGYGMIISDVLKWSAENPDDWKKTWQLIENKWDKKESCPDGSLSNFNIDARLNGAYIALGLLYGNGDFAKTLEISTRAGQDSDCNPSSAAGVLGVVSGYEKIPDTWKSGIPAIADKKFSYTNYSFNSITKSSVVRALKVIEIAGGKVSETDVSIPNQQPKAWKLEQWSMGNPEKGIDFTDPAWTWKGIWTDELDWQKRVVGKSATSIGSEVSTEFTGTAIAILGKMSADGGRADVFIDGKKAGTLDAYIPKDTYDDALWHIYGLRKGKHTIRMVTRDDSNTASKGKRVTIGKAIIYGEAK